MLSRAVEWIHAEEARQKFSPLNYDKDCTVFIVIQVDGIVTWVWPAWKMSYDEIEERYRMLVLHGLSRTGKSRLARSLFGEDRTLVVDVQHAEHPDLRGFQRNKHKAVLLDEVATPSVIVNNKKVLQAHVDGAILGQSPTQTYTYEVFLWRVPIILTTNNWRLDKLTDEDSEWVNANCIVVHVAEPVFDARRMRV